MALDTLLEHIESDINISDLLLSEGGPIVIRKTGDIVISENTIDSTQMDQIIQDICGQNHITRNTSIELDLGYSSKGGYYYRINLFLKSGARSLAIRKITSKVMQLEDIMTGSLAQTIRNKVLGKKSGLFLVTGTAGSGKSTTLTTFLEYINSNFTKHVLTIEDPIEFVYQNDKSLFSQRQVGKDTASFASGLKSLLRQNPDVILVGEIRDPESAEAVINIAETGHLVLSTLHTKAGINTISRLVSFFPPHYQDSIKDRLADVYLGSLAQQLVKIPSTIKITDVNRQIIGNSFGRIATYELLLNNTAMANTIRKGDFKQIPSLIQTSRLDGMTSMEDYSKTIGLV
ncbi:MAG: ATPase, T2SS/T4P/T4SS family [Candidatus Absconditabacterales bacterium]